jgi:hypothetical protein
MNNNQRNISAENKTRDNEIQPVEYNPCIDNYKRESTIHGPFQGTNLL